MLPLLLMALKLLTSANIYVYYTPGGSYSSIYVLVECILWWGICYARGINAGWYDVPTKCLPLVGRRGWPWQQQCRHGRWCPSWAGTARTPRSMRSPSSARPFEPPSTAVSRCGMYYIIAKNISWWYRCDWLLWHSIGAAATARAARGQQPVSRMPT